VCFCLNSSLGVVQPVTVAPLGMTSMSPGCQGTIRVNITGTSDALEVFIKALHIVHPNPNWGHAHKLVVGSAKNSLFTKKVFSRAKPT
jgi:hypothetical protein